VKKIPKTRSNKCSKRAKETDISLEAHTSTGSSDDVSESSCFSFSCVYFACICALTCPFP
jgi:hypothetical protein